jgi:hypothetical protein
MNKKLIIAAALCGLALGSRAQTEKGNFLLGGSFGFNSKKDDDAASRTNSFALGPKFGYFISNNFVIGLDASYYYTNKESWVTYTGQEGSVRQVNNGFRSHGIYISPFARYYIDLNAKFKFFSNLSVSAGKSIGRSIGEPTTGSYLSKYKSEYYGASLSPGFAFFAGKRLAIEFSTLLVSYQRDKYSTKYSSQNTYDLHSPRTSDFFQFGLSTIQPSIGINYHF